MYEKLIKEYFDKYKACAEFHFNGQVNNPSREREHVEARQAVYIAMEEKGYTYQKIYRFTPFTRANIFSGIRAGRNMLATDKRFRRKVEAVIKEDYTDIDKLDLIAFYEASIKEYQDKIIALQAETDTDNLK